MFLHIAITVLQTFHAGVANFEKHLEVTEARFRALKVSVWNSHLTSFSSGALGVQQTDDVRGTAEEAFVLTDGSLIGCDAFADTMSPVHGLLYDDHLVLPALRLKCLQLTEFLQLTYTYATDSDCLID